MGPVLTGRDRWLQPGGVKIWRPRQVYVGAGLRDYVDIDKRKDTSGGDPKKAPTKVPRLFSGRHLLADWDGKDRVASKL